MSLFAALQMTRGWRFRKEMNDLGTFAMHQYVETLSPDYFRDWLRSRGEAHQADSVAAFRERVLGPQGPRLVMGQAFAVQGIPPHGTRADHPSSFPAVLALAPVPR